MKDLNKVVLCCPICKRTRMVQKHSSDPVGTVKIVMSCDKCNHGGFDDVSYFDKDDKQLLVP